jgi:hypothetical protein
MIRIRQRGKPYEELELHGSRAELQALRDIILQYCASEEPSITVALPVSDGEFMRPEQLVRAVRICRTDGLLLLTIAASQLLISGRVQCLEVFARNLPCDPSESSANRAHVRLDRLGLPSRISEASLEIVLTGE